MSYAIIGFGAPKARIVILAVPFGLQNERAKAADWQGKIVIDATNAYGVSTSCRYEPPILHSRS